MKLLVISGAIFVTLTAALSTLCFMTGKPELGAVNAALTVINVVIVAVNVGLIRR